ncbi:PGF-CTERM-anchored ABC transporter substrate-binding protein [Halobaculum sp. MBLA0143]|uniref:PGF-CTERM-anchored ABC transporter substrate-binding protein n=1 Tax=Halobaculum sp. MBLA0143 TaxID=3079933 RepID=UPI0035233FD6
MTEFKRLAATLAVVALLALAPVGVAAAGAVGVQPQTQEQIQAQTQEQIQAQTQTTCEFPVTTTDATGTEVTVTERPERVTTLQPSAAQTMWEIGGRDQVVGVSKYATYLDGAGERTNISTGGFGGASVEKVVGTEPDLVLAPNVVRNETIQSLRNAGLTVFKFEGAGDIADVRQKTTLIGKLTGNCAGAAEANAWMTANVEAVSEATADTERPTVLYPLSGGFVVGEETFITQMIRAAGGQNVFRGEISGYREVSSEVVLTSEPDVVVFGDTTAYLAGEKPYRQLSAVQQNRTVTVNTNWLNQPAPRSVVYGVRNLSAGVAPETTADVSFPARDEVSVATETPTATETPEPAATETPEPTATETPEPTTSTSAPGMGAVVALVAAGVAALLGRRRA